MEEASNVAEDYYEQFLSGEDEENEEDEGTSI